MGEIPPQPWAPGRIDVVRQIATARFFVYRWQLRPDAIANALLPQPRAAGAATAYAANADMTAILVDRPGVSAITDYTVDHMDTVAHNAGARMLIAMDGDRGAICDGTDSPALELNRLVASTAARRGVPFVDLNPAFARDWQRNHRRVDFDSDGHWNETGHAVAARAIADALKSLPPRGQ